MGGLNKLIFFLICAVIVATTLAYGTVHQPTIALFYVTVVVMTLLWALDCYLGGGLRFSRSVLQVPLLALAAYGLVQMIPFGSIAETAGVAGIPRTISMEPFSTEMTSLHLLALALFFSLSLVYLESAARLRRMVTVILVFGFTFAFFAILQSFLSPAKIYGIYGSQFAAPFGSFVSRHNFAAYMEMTMAVPLGLLFAGAVRPDKKLLYITAIALMGAALLLSGSRGGFVSLLAEVILLVILTTRSRGAKNIALKIALAVLLIGAVVAGAVFVGGDTSLTRFAETANAHDISTNRMHIWDVTLKVISSNMPFGAGLGAFAQAYTPFDTLSGVERVEQAHNDYLQVMADAGIVGIAIGGAFLFWLFGAGLRNSRSHNGYRRGIAIGAFAGCFAILVHSMFDFVLHTTAISILFLTLMAMLVAAGRKYDDDTPEFDDDHPKHRRRSATVTSIAERR